MLLSETHRRLIRDPSKTDMPNRRPRHASSETDMPNRRPIGEQHVRLETHRRPRHASLETYRHVGLQWGMSVSDGSPMGHVSFRMVTNVACQGTSDGSPTRQVSLRWGMSVTDGACRFLMGLQSGMLVSDVTCRGL